MKYYVVFFLSFFLSLTVTAQTAEDSVKAVVNDLFTAMKNADPVLLKSVFADSAILQTITRNKEGKTEVKTDEVSGFIDFVGKQAKDAADERISFDVIRIDGPLAIVWTPYKFYFNGKFSHCGVNSFQLVRFNGNWKIQYLIDTRRRAGCEQ
ncbi:MAG: nuclear transport factor 2 family protein [Ferruginibacter sp.]|nr:nuclear transport factor 2 family protein [Chitinophagaceae bacterium]MBP6285450.1 nuclear transport factor 2 family protein [Ferruginibacter sp.]MBU9935076.1 nuclear transport factor 2 family protein [Ferruginibacter sp.]HQY11888.1 nuclear transport factor 2 family protein [Ferruginibacter sp.]